LMIVTFGAPAALTATAPLRAAGADPAPRATNRPTAIQTPRVGTVTRKRKPLMVGSCLPSRSNGNEGDRRLRRPPAGRHTLPRAHEPCVPNRSTEQRKNPPVLRQSNPT